MIKKLIISTFTITTLLSSVSFASTEIKSNANVNDPHYVGYFFDDILFEDMFNENIDAIMAFKKDFSENLDKAITGDHFARQYIEHQLQEIQKLAKTDKALSQWISQTLYSKYPMAFCKSLSLARFSYLDTQLQMNLLIQPSDGLVRKAYNELITQIFTREFQDSYKAIHYQGEILPQELIQQAISARSAVKSAMRTLTSYLGMVAIYATNLYNYQSLHGPYTTFEWSCESGYLCQIDSFNDKTLSEDKAYSALKTDGAYLGLKGNEMGEKIKFAKAINDICQSGKKVYPEGLSDNSYQLCEHESCKIAYQIEEYSNVPCQPKLREYQRSDL